MADFHPEGSCRAKVEGRYSPTDRRVDNSIAFSLKQASANAMPITSPLRFEPLFRRYIWGGRRLATHLQKPIGPESDFAESWEVVDHGDDQSRVAGGAYRGETLRNLLRTHGEEILGGDFNSAAQQRFPLLFKFLDANRKLSVQVHPNDAAAAKLNPPDLGKTEAWVILHAEPGSCLYAGLKRGFDRRALEREVQRGTTELCLHRIEPRAGDCFFIPAGVVHALGEGLVVAEIQQASDTTFRLFDWNRVGADGKSRPLHVAESLATINYEAGPIGPQIPQATEHAGIERLVACDKFVLDRWRLGSPQTLATRNQFQIVAVTAGTVEFASDNGRQRLAVGQTMLVPAALASLELEPQGSAELLVMRLP